MFVPLVVKKVEAMDGHCGAGLVTPSELGFMD
jgi:hypothetical protein